MTSIEIVTVIGCLVLGYWIMAVFVPSLMDKETYSEDREGSSREGDSRGEDVRHRGADEDEDPWHEILGVAEDASPGDISAAYKRRIREYHPDRVAQMGQDIRDVAERKSRQINAAYNHAMKLRG